MILVWILLSTFLVSLISFVGIFTFAIRDKWLKDILLVLVGFSAGSLIGGAFLHLIPEALEKSSPERVFINLLLGFIIFFILERYFYWRHCHDRICNIHTFSYLNLIGDGVHNFLDGLIIASSFSVAVKIGIVSTLAVVSHEIPQELGDFAVLVYGGFKKTTALFYNFISGLTAMLGALVGYFLLGKIDNLSAFLLPIAAGGFIYIGASDLIPELHKQSDFKRSNFSFLAFLGGIALMWGMRQFSH